MPATTTRLGLRPVVRGIEDAPTPGPVAVVTFTVTMGDDSRTARTVRLLGGGRDAAHREALVTDMAEATAAINATAEMHAEFEVSEVFETITAALEAHPGADLIDATARRMHRAEAARIEQAEAVEGWLGRLQAAGRECCDRCGGAGGYRGWPGFTCHKCGGVGHVHAVAWEVVQDGEVLATFTGTEAEAEATDYGSHVAESDRDGDPVVVRAAR